MTIVLETTFIAQNESLKSKKLSLSSIVRGRKNKCKKMGCCFNGKKYLKKLLIAFNVYYWVSKFFHQPINAFWVFLAHYLDSSISS